jgi:RNA polymerase sigma-70 factor (ECF subfamily)
MTGVADTLSIVPTLQHGDDDPTALALAAGRGDRVALERFVRVTQREVWRLVAHLAGVDRADDLTQETYLRAIPSLARFAGRASARTWLLSIARRVVVDQIRAKRSRPKVFGTVDWVDAADRCQVVAHRASAGFEDVVELNVLLNQLEPERREALVLTQVLGLTYAEAAEVCRCPVGTIRSRVARARDDLDAFLADGERQDSTG